jgi:hypothetical protein
VNGEFDAQGYKHHWHHYRVDYQEPASFVILSTDWAIDNWSLAEDGEPNDLKKGEDYTYELQLDSDDDGELDHLGRKPLYDLRLANKKTSALFLSANAPGPTPPDPVSRYYEVDPTTAAVLSTVDGPVDLYAAGIVFIGQAQQILAMDIRIDDEVYVLDLSAPPTLNQMLLYPDPIPTNSGTADLAGCSQLPAEVPF